MLRIENLNLDKSLDREAMDFVHGGLYLSTRKSSQLAKAQAAGTLRIGSSAYQTFLGNFLANQIM